MLLQFLGTQFPSYESDFFVGEDFIGAGMIGIFAIVYILILLLSMALSTAVYVLQSLGLYTIAKRRGIRNGWLAWIPMGNMWILGSISDQYQYVAKGKIKSRRKLLLGLGIGVIAVYIAWVFSMIMSIILSEGVGSGAAMAVVFSVLAVLAVWVLAVILTVYQYIAYYDLFCSCDPGNSVLYLVLSILFNVTLPFFVFFCRKKDLGMPPRKQAPVQAEPKPAEDFVRPEDFEDFAQAEQTEETE